MNRDVAAGDPTARETANRDAAGPSAADPDAGREPPAHEPLAGPALRFETPEGSQQLDRKCTLYTLTFRPLQRPGKSEYPVGRASILRVAVTQQGSVKYECELASVSGDSVCQVFPVGLRASSIYFSWSTVYGGVVYLHDGPAGDG